MRRITILVAVLACGLALASSASAASKITGCFSYNGVRYNGIQTAVQYKTTSGGWAYLNGSLGLTRGNGCATYKITGRYRRWYLRINGAVYVPAWRGLLVGSTPYYGGAGRGTYRLGTGRMSFTASAPAQVPRPLRCVGVQHPGSFMPGAGFQCVWNY